MRHFFSSDPRYCVRLLYDFQLCHNEHPVCSAVSFPRWFVPVFRLFSLEERQRQSEIWSAILLIECGVLLYTTRRK